jgi:hypothetical protein
MVMDYTAGVKDKDKEIRLLRAAVRQSKGKTYGGDPDDEQISKAIYRAWLDVAWAMPNMVLDTGTSDDTRHK